MKGTCIQKIKSSYFDLRPSEQKVAEFVIKNIEPVSKLSISDLANEINVSQPTIMRFVKNLGYSGYREFKDDIIKELGNDKENKFDLLYGFNISEEDSIKNVPSKAIGTSIKILEELSKSISIDSFEKAIEMILKARQIDIYGVENSMSIINDLANKLLYLGLNVRTYTDIYMQSICASNLSSSDLAIGISYSGTSKDTVDIMKRAKESGANTLVITNFDDSIINEYADTVVHSSNGRETIYGNAIFSRTSQTVIVDMIYMGIIASDYNKFSKMLDKNGDISRVKSY